jgi:hypothetical protein
MDQHVRQACGLNTTIACQCKLVSSPALKACLCSAGQGAPQSQHRTKRCLTEAVFISPMVPLLGFGPMGAKLESHSSLADVFICRVLDNEAFQGVSALDQDVMSPTSCLASSSSV